jgi:cyclophilin family peptidyl-prolyl cis-trans isomerase
MHRTLLGWVGLLVLAGHGWAGTLAQFRTVIGDIAVELFDADKPATVQNFIRLVQGGAYANTFFHRCGPGVVVQGGGFTVANPASDSTFTQYFFVPHFGRITNEYSVGRAFSNAAGTIAMARVGGEINSATSQFFFNLADNRPLDSVDGGFTVFGRVVSGLDLLAAFNTLSPNDGLIDLRKIYGTNANTSAFAEVPVRFSGFARPAYRDLVYVDITLLSVQVKRTNGVAHISWNSVKDKTQPR